MLDECNRLSKQAYAERSLAIENLLDLGFQTLPLNTYIVDRFRAGGRFKLEENDMSNTNIRYWALVGCIWI